MLLAFFTFLYGCGDHIESELTIEETIDKETDINWSTFNGDISSVCSIPEYIEVIDSVMPDKIGFDFVYFDIDDDGNRDVIVRCDEYPFQFVVIKREGKYYGIVLSPRQAECFYTNRYVLGAGGRGYQNYYRLMIDEEEIVIYDVAVRTADIPPKYMILGNEVDKKEYEGWIAENCKEEITFEHYEETIPRP